MLPALSTTTLPWRGPITDFPSDARPQPGTVSNVIMSAPHPHGLFRGENRQCQAEGKGECDEG